MAQRDVESLAYSLHFHSLANYISADYYEELGQLILYLLTLLTALVTTGGGTLVASLNTGNNRVKTFATLVMITSTIATEAISRINSSDQSPAKKKDLHHQAASRMKELRIRVVSFLKKFDESGLERADSEFEGFISEQRKIEEECTKSESWTFPRVHEELSSDWKALGIKLGKYNPDEKVPVKRYVNPQFALLCGSIVVLIGLLVITLYIA